MVILLQVYKCYAVATCSDVFPLSYEKYLGKTNATKRIESIKSMCEKQKHLKHPKSTCKSQKYLNKRKVFMKMKSTCIALEPAKIKISKRSKNIYRRDNIRGIELNIDLVSAYHKIHRKSSSCIDSQCWLNVA
jgi:hypothetical protein